MPYLSECVSLINQILGQNQFLFLWNLNNRNKNSNKKLDVFFFFPINVFVGSSYVSFKI